MRPYKVYSKMYLKHDLQNASVLIIVANFTSFLHPLVSDPSGKSHFNPIQAGGLLEPYRLLCFSFICGPITTKLGMLVL